MNDYEGLIMAEKKDGYRGDLDGAPVPHAAHMRCGVCLCGDLIGVDLIDAGGKTIAHGHMDVETALEFATQYGNAIEEVMAATATSR